MAIFVLWLDVTFPILIKYYHEVNFYQWILAVRVTSSGKICEKWCQIISHLEILFREFGTLIAWKIKIVIQIIRMGYSKFMHFCKWNHNRPFNQHPEKWFEGYLVKSRVFIGCQLWSSMFPDFLQDSDLNNR